MHHTLMHAHTPTHNLCLWPKRPPLAFSVTEASVAEMSGPKRPRPKCPWPKCPTFVKYTVQDTMPFPGAKLAFKDKHVQCPLFLTQSSQ